MIEPLCSSQNGTPEDQNGDRNDELGVGHILGRYAFLQSKPYIISSRLKTQEGELICTLDVVLDVKMRSVRELGSAVTVGLR